MRPTTDVFAAIEGFLACRTPQEVGNALALALQPYGLSTYAVGGMPPPSDPNPTPFTLHNWPQAWNDIYFERNFGEIDPVARAAMVSAMPFTLTDLREGRAGVAMGPEMDAYFAAAAELGRNSGLVVPIHGPLGYHGIVVFAGHNADPQAPQIPQLHLLALYAHDRMFTLFGRGPGAMARLTPREVEVLRHARNGLGDEEVAALIGITARTVRFHFENARKSLGARSRVEALMLASGHHLLGA